MSHTLSLVYIHVVFATKGRLGLIESSVEDQLHKYLCGIARKHLCSVLAISGMSDHVHLLFQLHPSKSLADLVKNLKAFSTGWLKRTGFDDFAWQNGYGAFSVSYGHVPKVKGYVLRQKQHHASHSLEDELTRFARACGSKWHWLEDQQMATP